MKEIWNVIIYLDNYAYTGWEEIIIGDPQEVTEFCKTYGKDNALQCWIKESYEVEKV